MTILTLQRKYPYLEIPYLYWDDAQPSMRLLLLCLLNNTLHACSHALSIPGHHGKSRLLFLLLIWEDAGNRVLSYLQNGKDSFLRFSTYQSYCEYL